MVHAVVRALPDDDALSEKNVKSWIKHNADYLKNIKHYRLSNDRKERAEYQRVENYVANLKRYLHSSIYLDLNWGPNRENRMMQICRTMAYDKDGYPKREVGVYYPDCGLWTQEMHDMDQRSR